MIWSDNAIGGDPALSCADSPSATLFCGDFSKFVLALWGSGLEVSVDVGGSNFGAAQATIRILCLADVLCTHPQAFTRISSIS
jgi:hypothetical protein